MKTLLVFIAGVLVGSIGLGTISHYVGHAAIAIDRGLMEIRRAAN